MAADLGIEMQEITRLPTTELRPKVDAVQQTPSMEHGRQTGAESAETFLAELRGLAQASGQECAIDGVEKVRLFVLGNVM
jgi:hypothetical protein